MQPTLPEELAAQYEAQLNEVIAASKHITDYKALLFDVYGTLVDWEGGIHAALQPLLTGTPLETDKAAAIRTFDATERAMQGRFPTLRYSELLARVHGALAEQLGRATTAEADAAFGRSIARWPVFADTVLALAALATHFKLFVLSNVDRASFAVTQRALEGPGGFRFTAVYTAEDAGAYKPAPGALAYALTRMAEHGIRKEDVLVVAQSLFHDVAPARQAGIPGVWIAREGAVSGELADNSRPWRWEFKTLGKMADAVENPEPDEDL